MTLLEGIVYLYHSDAKEVAVLVADEASSSPLSSKQHGAVGAGFRLRRFDPATQAACWTVGVPRLSTRRRSPSNWDRALLHNPVVDALELVRAWHARRRGALLFGAAEDDTLSTNPRGWSLDLQPHLAP
jgi:hypothetical protein